jgi:hypothetical protein
MKQVILFWLGMVSVSVVAGYISLHLVIRKVVS